MANKKDETLKMAGDVSQTYALFLIFFSPSKWLQASPYKKGEITILKPWVPMVFMKPIDVIYLLFT